MFVKFICSIILSLGGAFAIANIENVKIKIGIRQIIAILFLSVATFVFIKVDFSVIQSLLTFVVMILTYKEVFAFNLKKAIISASVVMALTILLDASIVLVTINSVPKQIYHSNYIVMIICNTYIAIGMYLITKIRFIAKRLSSFINQIDSNKIISVIFQAILVVVILFLISYNVYRDFKFDINYIINLLIYTLVAVIGIVYIRELNNYSQLLNEYDKLIETVQTFEDWIEDEQLEIHESKNTLSAIYEMTDIKEIKKEINSILNRSGTIEDSWIATLKAIPKGGLKGLLYYKFMITKNKKINLICDVSSSVTKHLKNLKKEDSKLLLRLIGIYFDNAIEASQESKKKNISFEVYRLKEKIHIVITNSFHTTLDLDRIGKKGVSTKGQKRGHGTYLANKLVSKNKNFEVNNAIINNYYVQTIIIK